MGRVRGVRDVIVPIRVGERGSWSLTREGEGEYWGGLYSCSVKQSSKKTELWGRDLKYRVNGTYCLFRV